MIYRWRPECNGRIVPIDGLAGRLARLNAADAYLDKLCDYCFQPYEANLHISSQKPAKYCTPRCAHKANVEDKRFAWRRQDLNRPEVQAHIEKRKVEQRLRRNNVLTMAA